MTKIRTKSSDESVVFDDVSLFYSEAKKELQKGKSKDSVIKKSTTNLEACIRLMAVADFDLEPVGVPSAADRSSKSRFVFAFRFSHAKMKNLGDKKFSPCVLLYFYGDYNAGIILRFAMNFKDYDFAVPFPASLRMIWSAPKTETGAKWSMKWGEERLEELSESLPEFINAVNTLKNIELTANESLALKEEITHELHRPISNNYHLILFKESPPEIFQERIVYPEEENLHEVFANICGVFLAQTAPDNKGEIKTRSLTAHYTYNILKKGIQEKKKLSGSVKLPKKANMRNIFISYNRLSDILQKVIHAKAVSTKERTISF